MGRPAPWSQLAGWNGQAFNTLTTPVLTTWGYYRQGGRWRSSAPAVSASPQEPDPSFSAPLGLLSAPPCSPPWRYSSTTTATTSPSSSPARESAATTSTTTRCRRWNCSARCSTALLALDVIFVLSCVLLLAGIAGTRHLLM